MNVCPVYQKIGGHSYGWVYSGPIGSILTPQLMDRKKSFALPYASTLCGACAEVCPVKIDIPRILVALRKRLVEDPRWGKASPWMERTVLSLWAFLTENRWAYEAAGWMARVLQAPFVEKGRIHRRLPPPVNRWSRYHTLPALRKRPFRKRWECD